MREDFENHIEQEYPEGYFEHYIEMFQSDPNQDGFNEHAELYVSIEGIETFGNLIDEIKKVEANEDWECFFELAKECEKEYLTLEKIKEMALKAIDVYNQKSK